MRSLLFALALSMTLAGCSSKENGYSQAIGIAQGTTEAELVRIAGPPTRTQPAAGDCAAEGGQRELIYEHVVVTFGGLLSDETVGLASLCVDPKSVVLSNTMINF